MTLRRWILIGVVAAVVAGVGGPFVYFRLIKGDQPAPLGLTSADSAPGGDTSSSGSTDGTWKVTSGSQAGYRVKETAFGQSGEAVGRTSNISGSIDVAGTTIKSGSFTADMASVRSDQDRRDNQFRGRIMDVATHPTSTFTLSEPVDVGSAPADGVENTYAVKGKLTLRGTTKDVTFSLKGRKAGSQIQVSGSIPIVFAEWNIPNPSFGPISTEDNGLLEFTVNFAHA